VQEKYDELTTKLVIDYLHLSAEEKNLAIMAEFSQLLQLKETRFQVIRKNSSHFIGIQFLDCSFPIRERLIRFQEKYSDHFNLYKSDIGNVQLCSHCSSDDELLDLLKTLNNNASKLNL
jgi:hypothetical protein